jgi:hypothetical protein
MRDQVTVCIAALCGDGAVFGIADRMLTSGDIQFEPMSPHKLLPLTKSIVAMAAGDAAFNAQILQDVAQEVQLRIQEAPDEWLIVRDVAEMYVRHRNEEKLKRAEAALLAPLGLTRDSFLAKQQFMERSIVERVTESMITFDVPVTEVIFMGSDPSGLHIYVVNGGEISCNDSIGFAAIGSGARHAESEFMLGRHSWNSPLPETLLRVYAAKKRAEIAPGVGEESDMVMVQRQLGSFDLVHEDVVAKLEEQFRRTEEEIERVRNGARLEMQEYVKQIVQAQPAQSQAVTSDGSGSAPSDDG